MWCFGFLEKPLPPLVATWFVYGLSYAEGIVMMNQIYAF